MCAGCAAWTRAATIASRNRNAIAASSVKHPRLRLVRVGGLFDLESLAPDDDRPPEDLIDRTIMTTIATIAASIAGVLPLVDRLVHVRADAGQAVILSPSVKASLTVRKNHPPAIDIIEFQTSPIIAAGTSSSLNVCHPPSR